MTAKELEDMLVDLDFVIEGHSFRKKKLITFQNDMEAKDFFVKFLLLETTAGVNYKDEELLETYAEIKQLAKIKTVISSKELPYHPLKVRPSEKQFIRNGCTCTIR